MTDASQTPSGHDVVADGGRPLPNEPKRYRGSAPLAAFLDQSDLTAPDDGPTAAVAPALDVARMPLNAAEATENAWPAPGRGRVSQNPNKNEPHDARPHAAVVNSKYNPGVTVATQTPSTFFDSATQPAVGTPAANTSAPQANRTVSFAAVLTPQIQSQAIQPAATPAAGPNLATNSSDPVAPKAQVDALINGLQSYFLTIEQALEDKVFHEVLPLLGNQLRICTRINLLLHLGFSDEPL